ncbi:toll-like receptor 2 type-1 isoform X2 [Anopheles coustani]|nr:toll-like receptor 2 type-1 isoform X2 [Anopheles coustani]
MYGDDYDDTYDDEEDDTGGLFFGSDGGGKHGADSDKSTSTTTGTAKASSTTTGSPPEISFVDMEDQSMEHEDGYACPNECSCSEMTKFLNCSHRSLTDIPAGLPGNVLRLDLSHNNLKQLNVEAFQNCTGLQMLLLTGNVIEQFDKELLLKMDRLVLLDLSSNQLAHLDSDSFSEVDKSLRRLHLSNNPIVLPDSGPFLELPELEELYLDSCNLTELPDETFSELRGLALLDLFGNQFDEDMSVDVFEPLNHLMKLRLPTLSESTVRELCDKVPRIDVIDLTVHNISCFYLASDSSFEESILVDVPKTPEPISTTKEPTTPRPTRKSQHNINEIRQEYKSSTSKLQASDSVLQTTTVPTQRNNSSQSGSFPSSASITHTGAAPVDDDHAVVKTSSTESNGDDGQPASLLSSISPETMKQLLMAIIGATVLALIVGVICRRTGIKAKLCGTKRRPAPTDQVRPAEEVPLNKV